MAVQKIGIDAGGSMVKLVYEESGNYHFKKYPIGQLDSALGWLRMIAPSASIAMTGGRSGRIQAGYYPDGTIIPEFRACCEGAVFLLKQLEAWTEEKFLLVNVGTGTSWYVVSGERNERILGSGIGGGTFMGLGALLSGEREFNRLTALANEGNRKMVDLLVDDIYSPLTPPIDGNLTASNFAKADANSGHEKADRIAALSNMIAETIVLLSKQAAAAK